MNDVKAHNNPTNEPSWKLDNLERRLSKLEDANILVLADRVAQLKTLVAWMLGTFVTFILTILGGLIIFLATNGTP
jgi:hypothetical protein